MQEFSVEQVLESVLGDAQAVEKYLSFPSCLIDGAKLRMIGHHILDQDHKIIAAIANILDYAVRHTHPINQPDRVFDTIAHFVYSHFGREEQILHSVRYPRARQNANQHRYMAEKFGVLRKQLHGQDHLPPHLAHDIVILLQTIVMHDPLSKDDDAQRYLKPRII